MSKRPQAPNKCKSTGLTLIELLVIILVVGLLVYGLGGTSCPTRESARRVVDGSNLRQIAAGMLSYAQENNGLLPVHPRDTAKYLGKPPEALDFYRNPYQKGGTLADRKNTDGSAIRFGGYVYLNLGTYINNVENPGELILVYTAKVADEQIGRNVLFADGHTEQWEEATLRAALPPDIDVDALDGP